MFMQLAPASPRLCCFLDCHHIFDFIFWQHILTHTDDICMSNIARKFTTYSHHTDNAVFCVCDHFQMCCVGLDSQCIFSVFTPVFLALEHQRQTIVPDLNRPTPNSCEVICKHGEKSLSRSIYPCKITQPHAKASTN